MNENEAIDTWNSCDQNQNNELEKKIEKLVNVVKYFINVYS